VHLREWRFLLKDLHRGERFAWHTVAKAKRLRNRFPGVASPVHREIIFFVIRTIGVFVCSSQGI